MLSGELKKLQVQCSNTLIKSDFYLILGNLHNQEKILKGLDKFSFLSPLEIKNDKIDFFAKYEVGSEEGVLALLLKFFSKKKDERLEEYLHNLDIGYISAECNLGEEEIEELSKKICEPCLIICEDLEFHERALNIAKLLSMLVSFAGFKLVYTLLDKTIENNQLHIADEIEELKSYDGAVIYFYKGDGTFKGSSQFAKSSRINDGDLVLIKTKNEDIKARFQISNDLKGTIGMYGVPKAHNSYAYEVSKVSRIES